MERINRTKKVLAQYIGGDPEDLLFTLESLVTDLFLLARDNGFDPLFILRRAVFHYNHEIEFDIADKPNWVLAISFNRD